MLNLLRMDLYRMLRSKGFYICFGVLTFISLFAFGMLYVIASPSAQDFLAQKGMAMDQFQSDTGMVLNSLSILDVFHQTNITGGFFAVTIGVLASLFIGIDFEAGFIKNILCVHENKWDYILSKLCCLSIVNLLYLVGTFLVQLPLNLLLGGVFDYSSVSDVLLYMVLVWMVENAFTALSLFICMLTRSKSAGIACAILINGGIIYMLVSTFLGLFHWDGITHYSLYYLLSSLTFPHTGADIIKPVIIAAVHLVLYTVIGKILLSKKDI